ncbi:FAD/NAD(P)-binding protein [Phytoactinopolyspora halotolerans]|uniref:Oxidoreductase n=1 Tax=Phytoactinopolyspora halotolerans TaxID=1981512 RepID=A0A6L9S7V4_9ACTN|nr:FAD/NAD(P)-binding protein [Phytoactinopolyspora halotolerans]NEE00642.1 oxidoreductase [Phytoactinopolyspora halotolerans]
MTTALPLLYRVHGREVETYDTVTLTLEPMDGSLPASAPGQFTMLTAFGIGEVPISISGTAAPDGRLAQTLRAVGAVTRALYHATPGSVVGLRGPYGVGWDLSAARGRDVVIVAGGIGIAPVWPVLQAVLAHRRVHRRVTVLIGARTPRDIVFGAEIAELRERSDVHVDITVDQASNEWLGRTGVVTTLLADAPIDPELTDAYVCGPEVMMRFTADALLRLGVPAGRIQLTLERNMRCGGGLCGHCQLGPYLICRDGPVVTYDRTADLLTVREL